MATITEISKLTASLASNKPMRKTKFGEREYIVDKDGNYEWQIEVMVYDEIGTDTIKIAMKSADNPVEEVPPATTLNFMGVKLQMGTFNRKQWAKLSAESVELANAK